VRLAVVCLAALPCVFANQKPPKDAARFFDTRVAPILARRCLGCHNEELKDGGVSFLDRDSLLRGGRRGPAIVPGDPERSALVQAIRHDGDVKMPPGPKLSARDLATLTEWVRNGAVWGTKLRGPVRNAPAPHR
jgi:hypothetical protein